MIVGKWAPTYGSSSRPMVLERSVGACAAARRNTSIIRPVLDAAATLGDLAVPPGNQLEALKGDRKGQHRIRINQQWRVCFVWKDSEALDAEIVDCH